MIAKKKTAKHQPKMSLIQKWVLTIALLTLIIITFPTVLVVTIGLLPSITILITDSQNSNKMIIVGCFNLTGVFVCLANLMDQIETGYSFSLNSNIFNLVVMLSAAALGMIFYYELPNLFIALYKSSSQKRLKTIETKLEKLNEEWDDGNQDKTSKNS